MAAVNIHLPNKFISYLVSLPENGMGYQLVKVFLKDGKVLRKHKVLNASILQLESNEHITPDQIQKVELEVEK